MIKNRVFTVLTEVISILLLVGMVIYLILNWASIPDTIPYHFNASGAADGWDNKRKLLIMPILAGLLYFMLTGVSVLMGVLSRIKAGNVPEALVPDLKSMLRVQKIEIMLLFFYLTYCMAESRNLSAAFLPVFLLVIFGTLAVFIVTMLLKNKRSLQ
jgi:uncharacterized membrane protein